MSNTVTYEQVGQLAAQLSPPEQLKLVAFISEQLSSLLKTSLFLTPDSARRTREAMADSLLAELDAIAESIEGQFDAVEDVRQIREERIKAI